MKWLNTFDPHNQKLTSKFYLVDAGTDLRANNWGIDSNSYSTGVHSVQGVYVSVLGR